MNLGALRSADYRRYFLGNVFALNGMWLCRVTLAWLAWAGTGQASFVGLVAFLVFAPTLVSGPFFGVLADRVALKRAALLTQSGLAASAAALLLAAALDRLSPMLLAGLALALGIVTSAHHPVRLALAPSLVPREAIASAVALGSLNFNLARLTGPAVGGLVISGLGAAATLALAVACFVPTLWLIAGLEPRAHRPALQRSSVLAALGEGIGHAARTPVIRTAMITIGIFSLVARGLLEILPVLADGVFARGAAGLGALTAAAGAGALAAAAVITLSPGQRPGRLPLASRIAAPAGLLLVAGIAWTRSWPVALVLTAALGLCGTLAGVGLQSTVQLALPDAFRARVMSLWTMLAVGGAAVGAILLGALIDRLGVAPALTLAAAAGLASLAPVLALPLAPRSRQRRSRATSEPPAPPAAPAAPAEPPTSTRSFPP